MRFNTRIFMLGLAGLLSAFTIGGIGWLGQQQLHDASQSQSDASRALRWTMNADMMHDALRSDVLVALRGAEMHDAGAIKTAQTDVVEHGQLFDESLVAASAIDLGPQISDAIAKTRPVLERYRAEAANIIALASTDPTAAQARLENFQNVFHELEGSNEALNELVAQAEANASAQVVTVTRNTRLMQIASLIAAGGLMTLLCLTTARFVTRRLGADPEEAADIARQIASGDLSAKLQARKGDRASLYAAMCEMQSQLRARIESEAQQAAENQQIRQALDSASTGLLVVDASGTLQHANRAAIALMEAAQDEVKRRWPEFSPDHAAGVAIDRLLAGAETSAAGETLRLADLTLRINRTPIHAADGRASGSVVEWRDRTAELAVEEEIGKIVDAAGAGDLSQRISTEGRYGFLARLATGINRILDANAVGVDDIRKVLAAMAEADLTTRMNDRHQGAFAETCAHMNSALDHLVSTLNSIREGAASVQVAASEIAAGNLDLSRRTEHQAASLEETAASVEQMTATIRQSVTNVQSANQLAQAAGEVAKKGDATVGEAVVTMSEISKASAQILDIINVIDSIAFQTNILALNASVEAARAGEQGRGFAVVATEVRSLSQRSSGAAKEIRNLITGTVEQVKRGADAVDRAGSQMGEILSSVLKVIEIMGQIATASAEQGHGIEQINQAITNIDDSTRQNAAMVEEITSAASSLDDQAHQLRNAVDVFQLDTKPNASSMHADEHFNAPAKAPFRARAAA